MSFQKAHLLVTLALGGLLIGVTALATSCTGGCGHKPKKPQRSETTNVPCEVMRISSPHNHTAVCLVVCSSMRYRSNFAYSVTVPCSWYGEKVVSDSLGVVVP